MNLVKKLDWYKVVGLVLLAWIAFSCNVFVGLGEHWSREGFKVRASAKTFWVSGVDVPSYMRVGVSEWPGLNVGVSGWPGLNVGISEWPGFPDSIRVENSRRAFVGPVPFLISER